MYKYINIFIYLLYFIHNYYHSFNHFIFLNILIFFLNISIYIYIYILIIYFVFINIFIYYISFFLWWCILIAYLVWFLYLYYLRWKGKINLFYTGGNDITWSIFCELWVWSYRYVLWPRSWLGKGRHLKHRSGTSMGRWHQWWGGCCGWAGQAVV